MDHFHTVFTVLCSNVLFLAYGHTSAGASLLLVVLRAELYVIYDSCRKKCFAKTLSYFIKRVLFIQTMSACNLSPVQNYLRKQFLYLSSLTTFLISFRLCKCDVLPNSFKAFSQYTGITFSQQNGTQLNGHFQSV